MINKIEKNPISTSLPFKESEDDRISQVANSQLSENQESELCLCSRIWKNISNWVSELIRKICSLFKKEKVKTEKEESLGETLQDHLKNMKIELEALEEDIPYLKLEKPDNLNHLQVLQAKIEGIKACITGRELCAQFSEHQEIQSEFAKLELEWDTKVQENKKQIVHLYVQAVNYLEDKEKPTITDLRNYLNYRSCLISLKFIDPSDNEGTTQVFQETLTKIEKESRVSVTLPLKGIPNVGNSCYLNSCIQALFATRWMQKQLKKPSDNPIIKALKNFNFTKTDALKLRKAIFDSKSHPELRHGIYEQKDAMALMSLLLQVFDTSLSIEEKKWNAEKEITDTQPAFDIQLILQENASLQELVESYFSVQNIEDTPFQSKCKLITDNGGPIVLSLKLFDERAEKNFTPVFLPDDGILDLGSAFDDGKEHKYRIAGCIQHLGDTILSGHYIAYRLHKGAWYECDDDDTRLVSYNDMRESPRGENFAFILEAIPPSA